MIALLGLLTVLVLLLVIISRVMSPLVALITVPVTTALLAGFGLDTAKFMVAGLQQTASVASMFVFAIVYFGVMTDSGLLDPVVDRILHAVGTNPTRIVVGTALLALLVHLDGSGAVTFLVTIPAMLPLYDRLGMDRRVLACVASMAAGYEVRLRVAARTTSLGAAQAVANEVESLYTNGPAGGGGATRTTREVLALASTFIPRELVQCDVHTVVA